MSTTKATSLILSLPNVLTAMTGVSLIRQKHSGTVILEYIDGSKEYGIFKQPITDDDINVFALIGNIQRQSRQI
jgi:hypothetical protein